jgi:carboxyl-terminal processing protease
MNQVSNMLQRLNTPLAATLFLWLAAFSATAQAQPEATAQPSDDGHGKQAQLTLDDLRTFTDVFNQVRRNYVEEVDDHTLLDSAIRGMLMELDPHSSYLPANQFRNLEETWRGSFTGIGVEVEARDGRILIRAVINGSPADEAGLNPGDAITSIDGQPVDDAHVPEAIDELSGDPQTEVEVGFTTPDGEERTVKLRREYLRIPTLSFQLLDEDWGYFKMTAFHRESATDFRNSLDSIAADGIHLRGIILDLRGNPGGVLQSAVALADGFLDEGVIVTTRGRNASMQMKLSAEPGQWLPDAPLAILVDRATASASEVFAGAMQDYGRGLVIGERTFGKGSVQSVLPLRNGGGIKLTTALYYTPSGRSIQAEGIVPDVVYHFAEEPHEREADLARHLENGGQPQQEEGALTVHQGPEVPVQDVLAVLEAAGLIAPKDDGAEPDEEAPGQTETES